MKYKEILKTYWKAVDPTVSFKVVDVNDKSPDNKYFDYDSGDDSIERYYRVIYSRKGVNYSQETYASPISGLSVKEAYMFAVDRLQEESNMEFVSQTLDFGVEHLNYPAIKFNNLAELKLQLAIRGY